jgi:hypothetical protein
MLIIESALEMASEITPPFRVGQVVEISFPTFTPRITVHSERELTGRIEVKSPTRLRGAVLQQRAKEES